LRLMVIVEQKPAVVLSSIESNPNTYQWFKNDWVKLCVIDPYTREISSFQDGKMELISMSDGSIEGINDLMSTIELNEENLPVCYLNAKEYGTVG